MAIQTTLIAFVGMSILMLPPFAPAPKTSGGCGMATTYAEMSAKNFKKAYGASSTGQAQPFLNKGIEQATEASAYAVSCGCNQAKNYALNAATYGQKASRAGNIAEQKQLAKQALDLVLNAAGAAIGCP